jgi:hypothetical protein
MKLYTEHLGIEFPSTLVGLLCTAAWLAGIVLAKGFWSTLLAVLFAFYSWYLVAEHLITRISL